MTDDSDITNAPATAGDIGPIDMIVVGIDGSAASFRAVRFAASLAAGLGARVCAVHAVGLLDVWPDHPEEHLLRNDHHHVAALCDGPWTEPLRTAGLQVTTVLRDGPPATVVLAVADEVDAQLIIVGNRGVGEAEMYTLGSTTARITQHSTRPVLVVPVVEQLDDRASATDGVTRG